MAALANQTILEADTFFSPNNHARAADWKAYPEPARIGALVQARRELETMLARELDAPVDAADATWIREDYALFEQALEILDRQPRQMTGSKAKRIGAPKEEERHGYRISPVALQYLKISRVKWARG